MKKSTRGVKVAWHGLGYFQHGDEWGFRLPGRYQSQVISIPESLMQYIRKNIDTFSLPSKRKIIRKGK